MNDIDHEGLQVLSETVMKQTRDDLYWMVDELFKMKDRKLDTVKARRAAVEVLMMHDDLRLFFSNDIYNYISTADGEAIYRELLQQIIENMVAQIRKELINSDAKSKYKKKFL